MNIICETALGANYHIMESYVNAFRAIGNNNIVFWDKDQRSTFDIFQEFEAQHGNLELYFGHSWKLTRALVRNLMARPYIKIILRAPHYGSGDDKIDKIKYPIQFLTEEEKTFLDELSKHPGFKYVTCQYSNGLISETHDLYKNFGLECKGILLCADVINYFYTSPDDNYSADVFFCGSYWPYKSLYLSWLHGLTYPSAQLKTIITGRGGWSSPSYVGTMSEQSIRKFYASSKVCPNLYEDHAITGGIPDLNQRLYQTSICGGFQISQRAIGIEEVFPDNEIVLCDDRKDFYEKVIHYVSHPEERLPFIKKAVKRVYAEHTNFHRTAEVLKLLDYNEEAERSLMLAKEAWEHVKNQVEEL